MLSVAASAQLTLTSTTGSMASPVYHYEITVTNTGTTKSARSGLPGFPAKIFCQRRRYRDQTPQVGETLSPEAAIVSMERASSGLPPRTPSRSAACSADSTLPHLIVPPLWPGILRRIPGNPALTSVVFTADPLRPPVSHSPSLRQPSSRSRLPPRRWWPPAFHPERHVSHVHRHGCPRHARRRDADRKRHLYPGRQYARHDCGATRWNRAACHYDIANWHGQHRRQLQRGCAFRRKRISRDNRNSHTRISGDDNDTRDLRRHNSERTFRHVYRDRHSRHRRRDAHRHSHIHPERDFPRRRRGAGQRNGHALHIGAAARIGRHHGQLWRRCDLFPQRRNPSCRNGYKSRHAGPNNHQVNPGNGDGRRAPHRMGMWFSPSPMPPPPQSRER